MNLSTEIAFDLMDGRMEKHREREWIAHFDSCAPCADRMEELRMFRTSLKRSHLHDAPDFVIESAIALFHAPFKPSDRPSIRQVIARLIFDSFIQPAYAGSRGDAGRRQLVLQAEELDIHMLFWDVDGNRGLLG